MHDEFKALDDALAKLGPVVTDVLTAKENAKAAIDAYVDRVGKKVAEDTGAPIPVKP